MVKTLQLMKSLCVAAVLLLGSVSAWAIDVPDPVYFNDFSSSNGLTIVGSGEFINDTDARFGMIYQNDPNLTKAVRTNYLLLPSNVLQHSATTKEMTIGFWVNKKNATDYYYSPIFTAYGNDNGTKSHAWSEGGENGWWPFFYAQTRGILQWNSNGYCDFTNEQNVAGTNTESTTWTNDGNWHFFTMTFTSSSAKVYVDGDIINSWNIAENGLDGLFTQTNLTYVCLGGNQAMGWNDADPAFGFDDFAVYDAALSAEQISQIINNKLGNDINGIPANYDFSTATTVAPFDNGTISKGTNVTALTVNNQTATAYFDIDSETEGKQPYQISSNEKVTFTLKPFHGYLGNSKDATISIVNSNNVTLASYSYNAGSAKITDVTIGGTKVTGFEPFNLQSSNNGAQGANGLAGNGKPYIKDEDYNPVISISIKGSGYVELSFTKGLGNINESYSTTLPGEISLDLAKVVISNLNNNADRVYHLSSLAIASETVSEATVTFKYEDIDGNALTEIKADQTAPVTIGEEINDIIPNSYKSTFYNEDNTTKYVYDSFSCDDEIVPSEGTVITLKFTKHSKFTHNVLAVDSEDNELGQIATGSAFEGESLMLAWNKYIKFGEQWYVTNAPYGNTYTESGTSKITYSKSDIINFVECENTTYNSAGDDNNNVNASGSKGVLLQSKKAMQIKEKINAGKYDISIYAYVRRANDDVLKLQYSVDGINWSDVEEKTFKSNTAVTMTWNKVELAEDSYIRFLDTKEQNSCHYYDYIVIAEHFNDYTIKMNSTDGITIATGTCKEGNDYTVTLAQVVENGGKFYVLDDESVEAYSKTFTMGSNDEIQTISYTEDPSIIYYNDGDPSNYVQVVEAAGYSGGNYVTANTGANHGNARNRGYSVGTLSAGSYEITAKLMADNRSLCVRINNGDYNSGNSPLVSLSGSGTKTGSFVLGGEKSIVLTGANSEDAYGAKSGHMKGFDYVIIRKTSEEAKARVKVTDAGYATFYSEYALDFSETGLTAYIAKAEGNMIVFETVTKIPANTGVLLKGTAGTYDIPVTESTDDVTGNLFAGSLIYQKIESVGILVLMNGDQGKGFYKTTSSFTVSPNTAYLPATTAGARTFIGFDEMPTGINETSLSKEDVDGFFYNLNGQRVAVPNKGLFIINGKKVIMK